MARLLTFAPRDPWHQACDASLQREMVLVLPDLVMDGQHAAAVEMLSEMLRNDSQFTAPVLDSLGSLQLNPEMLKQVSEMVTDSVASANVADLPVVIRFLLQHMTKDTAKDVVDALRSGLGVEALNPDGDTAEAGQPGGETLVLDAVQSALRLRRELTSLVLEQLEKVKHAADHRAVDWWLICALHTTSVARDKTKVHKLVQTKAAKAQITRELLQAAIVGHSGALRPHYQTHLELAGKLLGASDATARRLGRSLYVLLLREFDGKHGQDRQELIGCLLTHVGSGNEAEVDAALQTLVQLASEHTAALSKFSAFLTGILDFLDSLTVTQARLVYELFARLACDAPDASRLPDELAIIIRKQLSNPSLKYKRLGMLGGCSLMARLGARRAAAETVLEAGQAGTSADGDGTKALPMERARLDQAKEHLDLMLKYATAADGSKSFMLRELSRMVASRSSPVSNEITDLLAESVTTNFETDYLVDAEAVAVRTMVHGLRQHVALGLDEAPEIALNLLPLLKTAECPAAQRHALSSLSSTFELLRVCEASCSENGELEAVDAILGAPLVLFDVSHLKDFTALSDGARSAACLALFYAIDWMRELLNAFATQNEPEMRSKVVDRLHQLRHLELELDRCLATTPHFRLPGDTGALFKPKPVKAPAAKKSKPAAKKQKKKASSEVDSSEDEGKATEDEGEAGEAAAPAETEDKGKGKAKATEAKPRGKPAAAGAHFARVAPQLRPLSPDVSLILTYAGNPLDGQAGAAAEHLRPAAVHYLLQSLHAALKTNLAGQSKPFGRPAAQPADDASELRGLSGAALLGKVRPALLSFRDHTQTLLELLPQVHLPASGADYRPSLDNKASFSAEPEGWHRPYVEPSLLLVLQCVRLLVSSPQLRERDSEPMLLRLLGHLGSMNEPPVGALSTSAAAEACASAFDFFLTLQPELPSLAAAHELVGLERALLKLQHDVAGGAREVPEEHKRSEQLASLAQTILENPPNENKDGKAAPSKTVIGAMFDVHASFTDSPSELLTQWTEELLPELEGAPTPKEVGCVDAQPLLTSNTVAAYLKVLFPLLITETKRLQLPGSGKKQKQTKKEKALDKEGVDPGDVRDTLASLHQLVASFVQLVSATRHFGDSAVLGIAIKASADFLANFNKDALPFISTHFLLINTEAQALLKAIQPATRLLQTHCASVKQSLSTSAATSVPKLKREIEQLIFSVKQLLKDNGCAEGFWMGNLKHKDSKGQEVSSQMQIEKKTKKDGKAKAKGGKKRKIANSDDEDADDEAGEEGADGGEEDAAETELGETAVEDQDEEDEEGEEENMQETDDDE